MEKHSLTILLALKDRVPFTVRWLRYANHIRLPFKVLIADGGSGDEVQTILSNRDQFPYVEYEYMRYPYDQTYSHYYAKLVDALARVTTPFVVHADNDDFFVVDGLVRSLEFMTRNPDFSSCRGTISGVRIKPNSSLGEQSSVYGNDIEFVAHLYPPGSTLDATAAERVRRQFSTYRTNWYDVFRTEQSRLIFQTLKDLDIKDLILAQHIPHLLGNVLGKIHRDTYLYLVRQLEVPGSGDWAETHEKGDHFDRMLMETWSRDFTGFVNTIAVAISRKDGIPGEEACRIVSQGYREFMARDIVVCLQVGMRKSSSRSPYRRTMQAARRIARFIRRQYRLIRGVMAGQPWELRFISGRRFAASNKDYRSLYDFLTNPAELEAMKGGGHS